MTDYSPLIARLSVNIELLREWDADGAWQHDPILLAYLRNYYSLTLAQANQLDLYLIERVRDCEIGRAYEQMSLLEPTPDQPSL